MNFYMLDHVRSSTESYISAVQMHQTFHIISLTFEDLVMVQM